MEIQFCAKRTFAGMNHILYQFVSGKHLGNKMNQHYYLKYFVFIIMILKADTIYSRVEEAVI